MQTEITDFLVIGAGLAGLAFAGDAAASGASVRLLDKGRGVGGRTATRRFGDLRVDHGAQYFTARGQRLQSLASAGLSAGWLAVWCRGLPLYKEGAIQSRPEGHPRYAPPSGMNALPKQLAQGLEVALSATVTEITRDPAGSGWVVRCADGQTFTGHRLVLNLPPTQLLSLAADLLPTGTRTGIQNVIYAPAWTLMARLSKDVPGANWPALEFEGHPVLGLLSRDHTKRGGADAPPVLVANGSGEWSRAHLEDDPASVQTALLAAAQSVTGPLAVEEAQVHRWRYAQPTQLFEAPFFWDSTTGIGGCGDWCDTGSPLHGGKVEAALESGWRLAAEAIR